MNPRDLRSHKFATKKLDEIPAFKPQKRGKLPKPLHRLGGPRIQSTGLIKVSADHSVIMYWRDGLIHTDRAFYGHLFCHLPSGSLSPLFEFHWHPSHKGMHGKVPCETGIDYTDRLLPGAPELALKTDTNLDPKHEADRLKLVIAFCVACGVQLPDSDGKTRRLW